jgi:sulfate/thiosulfate transport system permease protein
VARELIPVLEAEGPEEELAALTLGASGWQTFWRVTLPNVKWGVFYGVLLCTARAAGEFGAVHVVSGRITGKTDTLPLRVEKLLQEYRTPAAFAVASVLTSLALLTLCLKAWLERAETSSPLSPWGRGVGGEGVEASAPPTPLPRSGGEGRNERKDGGA